MLVLLRTLAHLLPHLETPNKRLSVSATLAVVILKLQNQNHHLLVTLPQISIPSFPKVSLLHQELALMATLHSHLEARTSILHLQNSMVFLFLISMILVLVMLVSTTLLVLLSHCKLVHCLETAWPDISTPVVIMIQSADRVAIYVACRQVLVYKTIMP